MGPIRETSGMSETERMAVRNANMQYLESIPHIIETGYTGGWHYLKLSDGTALLWGLITETGANMTVKDNGIYQSAQRRIALPFAVSNAVCTGQLSNGVLLTNAWASVNDSKFNYTVGHIEPRESQDFAARIFIIGNWK